VVVEWGLEAGWGGGGRVYGGGGRVEGPNVRVEVGWRGRRLEVVFEEGVTRVNELNHLIGCFCYWTGMSA
jgi:hypothetical protein